MQEASPNKTQTSAMWAKARIAKAGSRHTANTHEEKREVSTAFSRQLSPAKERGHLNYMLYLLFCHLQ
jgi:hypothetical protein